MIIDMRNAMLLGLLLSSTGFAQNLNRFISENRYLANQQAALYQQQQEEAAQQQFIQQQMDYQKPQVVCYPQFDGSVVCQ